MALREILVELGIEVDPKSEKRANAAVDGLKRAAVGAAAAIAGIGVAAFAINRVVDSVRALGDQTAKTAKQLGVNAERLQELTFAANLAGASAQDVNVGLRTLARNALEASQGTKSFVEDFARLGVNVRDANGQLKPTEQIMLDVADGMQRLGSETERTALAQTLMGRGGAKLVPLMVQGSDAIRAQAQRARELGEVMGEELLKLTEDYTDAQREQEGAVRGLKNVFAEELLPTFISATKELTEFTITLRPMVREIGSAIAEFLKGNREFIRSGAVRAFRTMTDVVKGLFTALRFLVSTYESLTDGMSDVQRAILGTGLALIPLVVLLGLPAVLLGVIGLAIIAVIQDLQRMGEEGEGVFATLAEGFFDLQEQFGSTAGALRQMARTAVSEWLEAIGVSEDLAEAIADLLPIDVVDAWNKFTEATTEGVNAVFEAVRALKFEVKGLFLEMSKLGDLPVIGPVLERLGRGGAGLGPAGVMAPAAAAGTRTMISQPTIEQNITVDASGNANPADTGREVQRGAAGAAVMDLRDAQMPVLVVQ